MSVAIFCALPHRFDQWWRAHKSNFVTCSGAEETSFEASSFLMCRVAIWGLDQVGNPRLLFLHVSQMLVTSSWSVLVPLALAQSFRNTCFETLRFLLPTIASLCQRWETDIRKHPCSPVCDPRGLCSDRAFIRHKCNAWMHPCSAVANNATPYENKKRKKNKKIRANTPFGLPPPLYRYH